MTTRIRFEADRIVVDDPCGLLAGRHHSQMAYWQFSASADGSKFAATPADRHLILDKVLAYFEKHGIACELSDEVTAARSVLDQRKESLREALVAGAAFKEGQVRSAPVPEFLSFLTTHIRRPLKPHQLKAALHLLAVGNGANFSVPGSGKTSVVLAVFAWLKHRNLVDVLFVVGPPSCFGPWRTEFAEVIGREANAHVLAGGNADDRRSVYNVGKRTLRELYLTSFQTLQRDWEDVQRLFKECGARFFLVIDEAHYIKQLGGIWATAVLNIAPHAVQRCVLTGTPFPRTYSDAFNLFDAIWPNSSPLAQKERIRIEYLAQKKQDTQASAALSQAIGPLFYRVRKQDLGLAAQQFNAPITVPMAKYEKQVYDSILDRIRDVSREDEFRNWDLLAKLRRGRMVRLRQTISYTKLLSSAVEDYNENLLQGNLPLSDIIRHYDDLEVPAKLVTLTDMVGEIRSQGEKVLVWSNFVQTLKLITDHLAKQGHGVRLIYGGTPTENVALEDEESREQIIRRFLDRSSGIDILVANPAACAESISLHKSCSHAIYYDLSYNCAQYLQSLDRIHRVGGSEDKVAQYHFLQYVDSVDHDVLANVQKKAAAMSAIIDRDYPIYDLDMFSTDDELAAYERLFPR